MAQMKPQFGDELTIRVEGEKQFIDLSGPIDLDGTEEDVYIWVMLHQPPRAAATAKSGGETKGAFGQGTAAYEHDDVAKLVSRATRGQTRWDATIEATAKTFDEGPVGAEAVVIVRGPKMNHIVWWDDNAELKFKT